MMQKTQLVSIYPEGHIITLVHGVETREETQFAHGMTCVRQF